MTLGPQSKEKHFPYLSLLNKVKISTLNELFWFLLLRVLRSRSPRWSKPTSATATPWASSRLHSSVRCWRLCRTHRCSTIPTSPRTSSRAPGWSWRGAAAAASAPTPTRPASRSSVGTWPNTSPRGTEACSATGTTSPSALVPQMESRLAHALQILADYVPCVLDTLFFVQKYIFYSNQNK